jgi:hypothetical protein
MMPPRSVRRSSWRRLAGTSVALALALFVLPAKPGAQGDPGQGADWTGDVPAHIAVVDGTASHERDGRVVDAEENVPLLAGDCLRTDQGRVEILFADGSALDLDEYAAVDLLSDSLLRLRAGRVRTPARDGHDRRAWTVVPARTFTTDVVVSRHAIGHETLPPAVLSQFVPRRSGPATPGARTRVEPLRSPTVGRGPAVERPSGARGSPGVVVAMPVPLREERRVTSRSPAPPSPDVPDRPSAPRAPGDPTRPGGGRAQPPTGLPQVDVAPAGTPRMPPPAPGHIGRGGPAPPSPPSPPSPPPSRGRGGGG